MTNLPESPASPDQPHGDRVLCGSVHDGVLGGLRSIVDVVTGLGGSSAAVDTLSDEAVLEGHALIAEARRALETQAAWFAAALARRSRPELGGKGLAARKGFRSPEDLLQSISGSSKGDAVKLLGVGRLVAETDAAEKAAREAEEAQKLLDETPPLDGVAPDLPPVDLPVLAAAVPPWHAPIGRALGEGWLSVEKADALRKGLGDLDRAITPEKLASALARLLTEARTLNADQLFKRARRVRDVLDEAGIAAREKAAYDDRSLRFYRLHTGQVRMVGLFAPEDGEYLMQTYDAITSPRRGGVRFVDKEQAAWAKRVQDDPRTTEQLTADAFLALTKLGVKADPKRLAGGRNPAVRMVTIRPRGTAPTGTAPTGTAATGAAPTGTAPTGAAPTGAAPAGAAFTGVASSGTAHVGTASIGALADGTEPGGSAPDTMDDTIDEPTADSGAGRGAEALPLQPGVIEGTAITVSTETLERNRCDSGLLDVTFDDRGSGVDLGREQRTFNPAQRAALALRDGGCMWPGCDRPPSWTETHHIQHWKDDHGETNLDDGILLCRSDHLRLHNEHWRIKRDDTGQYWLSPPPALDPEQRPILLTSKSQILRDTD
ncbi:HNH endonuclease signature motif containing protein [Cryobacterium zhongshanensis]|uniref:HNH endonuclease n=1 Tax=Cryobacterium zhongshanensis TaxID=2928153 RepID=A0AA41UG74_9MICO|nr:HNH endonuclease signature motif containing protein [Cryobacterium zhongshanensis]MCI4658685.1 HNH endonuclease [Cryobacterium zhongshanensis]